MTALLGALLRSPLVLSVLAAAAMVGLLVAFVLVAQGVRQRSVLRHHAEAEQMRSQWQCAALSGSTRRDSCRLQLASAQP